MESSEQFRLRYLEDVKVARLQLNLTQEEFAKLVGVSRRTVAGWENGDNLPQPRHRQRLDEIIKVAKQKAIEFSAVVATAAGLF